MAKAAASKKGGSKMPRRGGAGARAKRSSKAPAPDEPKGPAKPEGSAKDRAGHDRAAEALKRIEAARENKPTGAGLSIERIGVLGQVTWLMSQTATHKHMFISDLEWMAIPPIALGQFRLWRQGGLPLAYASWAYLSDEAAARAKEGVRRLAPIDWKSGENLVLMDLIAPFGGGEEALRELRENVFDRDVETLPS